MMVKVMREQEVLQEAAKVLLKYLEPAKVALFGLPGKRVWGTIWRFVRNCLPERRWPLSMIKFWPIKAALPRSNGGEVASNWRLANWRTLQHAALGLRAQFRKPGPKRQRGAEDPALKERSPFGAESGPL